MPVATLDRHDAGSVSSDAGMAALLEEFDQPDAPGLAVGIYRGGEPLYVRGHGYADLEQRTRIAPQTVFHVASVSKQFAAVAIALLARDGKVDLNADVRTYLPFVADFEQPITVLDLIHHTSGLRDYLWLFALGGHSMDSRLRQQQGLQVVARQRELNFPPGSEYSYSNTGYVLLAEIVRVTSGRTLRQFAHERIFQPLGMTHTLFVDDMEEIVPGRARSYDRDDDQSPWHRALFNNDMIGASGVSTTVDDMRKWAGNLAHPTVGDRQLITQITTSGTLRDGTSVNYGFGLSRQRYAGREAIGHGGADAGYRAQFAYFPAEDFTVVLLANRPIDLQSLTASIVTHYLGATQSADAAHKSPIEPDAATLKAIAGTYFSPLHPLLSLVHKDGKLQWQTAFFSKDLVFRSDGTFDLGSPYLSYLRPRRNAQGQVTTIEWIPADRPQQVTVLTRAVRAQPSTGELRALAGKYRSEELDTTYMFSVENGKLVARSLWWVEPATFKPSIPDHFDSDARFVGTAVVVRDAQRRPIGFRLNAGRVRNLWLERIDRP